MRLEGINLRQLKTQPKRIIAKIGIMVFITWDMVRNHPPLNSNRTGTLTHISTFSSPTIPGSKSHPFTDFSALIKA